MSPIADWSFATGDFNNDGRLDVAGYHSRGVVRVGINTVGAGGQRSFTFSQWGTVTPAAGWVVRSGDFTRDGRADTAAVLKAETPPAIKSIVQGIPNPDPPERGIPRGAEWRPTFSWQIPSTWTSGLYSARLEQPDPADPTNPAKRRKFDIPFVVKATTRKKIAVLANVNTWDAYNRWNGTAGNRGKYDGVAHTSFLRPNLVASPVLESDGHLTRTERYVLGWLEDNNYPYDLYTDIDFHDGAVTFARGYRKLVLTGHPEYWTTTMRQRLKEFLDAGGSLVYLGGNGIFESMEYGDQTQCNGGSSTCVHAQSTYLAGHDAEPNCGDAAACRAAARPWRAPVMFRALTDNQGNSLHEINLLGVATATCSGDGEPYLVQQPNHALFEGTSLFMNSPIGVKGHPTSDGKYGGGASGHEIDRIDHVTAANVPCPPLTDELIKHLTPFKNFRAPANRVLLASAANGADMTFYQIPNKGFVFAAGSIIFGRSLAFPTTTDTTENWEIRRLMRNVMNLPDLP